MEARIKRLERRSTILLAAVVLQPTLFMLVAMNEPKTDWLQSSHSVHDDLRAKSISIMDDDGEVRGIWNRGGFRQVSDEAVTTIYPGRMNMQDKKRGYRIDLDARVPSRGISMSDKSGFSLFHLRHDPELLATEIEVTVPYGVEGERARMHRLRREGKRAEAVAISNRVKRLPSVSLTASPDHSPHVSVSEKGNSRIFTLE